VSAYKINGKDAVRIAERDGVEIQCYASPIDDGGVVSAAVAREIAKADPGLVYVSVVPNGWWNGQQFVTEMPGYNVSDYFRPGGMYLGPDEDGVEPRWHNA